MTKTILNVDGIACEHCVKSVTTAVTALPGIDHVAVNIAGKTVTVDYDASKTTIDKIKAAIDDQGYEVVSVQA